MEPKEMKDQKLYFYLVETEENGEEVLRPLIPLNHEEESENEKV